MTDDRTPPPTDDDRRRAACAAMASAPGLIRFASRFTRSLHDAEDAYQRAMEIALTRAPVTEPRRFMAWLHTVLRHEALAVSRARRREGPGAEADVPEAYGDRLEDAVPVDALAEWRERYRAIQDGLAGLTEAQRVCLLFRSAGVSYERIHQITGYSLRKVERSILEGRASLSAWEVRLAEGEACLRLDGAIARVATGEATAKERRTVSRHVRHCGACRAVLRDRRASNEWMAGLVPVALVGGGALSGVPDPTPALAWWDRLAGGATVRAGTAIQTAMELPGTALAKVGAGTAALAVAGVAGAPVVADAVRPAPSRPSAVTVERIAEAPPAPSAATRPAAARSAPAPARAQPRRARPAPTHARARAAVRRAPARRAAPVVAVAAPRAPAPARSHSAHATPPPAPAPPAAPSPSAVALEFGP
ncbi:RNA polymerase sigma factor [Miltoncostaea marina]|uniref:RNA polymerase sigma factor n=1 Tax=Miltoncostaea marina TaxID=2843215 RepID=UPI001C3DB7FC|nr:sigma-70 family RNA polymerase sigma factor [Miltoncostaea marina]